MTSRRSSVLLRFYAFMLCLAFIVLLAGVACSVRVIFTIYIGVNHSLAVPLMKSYGKDPRATSAWDNLHSKYVLNTNKCFFKKILLQQCRKIRNNQPIYSCIFLISIENIHTLIVYLLYVLHT